VEEAVRRDGNGLAAALAAVAVWVRLSAARHLTWNRNYNVKPREISAAQVWLAPANRTSRRLQLVLRSHRRCATGCRHANCCSPDEKEGCV